MMLTLLLVYVLGGVTFIPLCLAAFFVHFLLTAPPADLATSTKDAIPSPEELGDTELSQEQKAEALQFAAENAAAHAESEKLKEAISRSQGQGQGQGRGSVRSRRGSIAPQPTGPKPHLSGWLTVRRQFEPDSSVSVAAASSSAAAGSGSSKAAGVDGKDGKAGGGYMSLVYRGLMDYRSNRADQRRASQAAPGAPVANGAAGESPADSRSNSPQPDSTVLSRSPTPAAPGAGTAGKEIFHCILKAPILYLYSSDDLSAPTTECYAAIDMRGKRVSVYAGGLGDTLGEPGDEEDDDEEGTSGRRAETSAKGWESVSSVGSDTETLGPAASQAAGAPNAPKEARNLWKRARRAAIRDGELFMKRNAIRIVGESSFSTGRSGQGASSDAASEKSDAQSVRSKRSSRQQHRPQWFIFARSATSMEDWYHALLHASLMPTSGAPESAEPDPMGTLFSRSDMSSLLSSLDELPDPIPLRWLNAMVGRVFFSVYRTAWLEDYITSKLMKKISRVRTPGFLGDVRVQEVDVGRAPPAFSRPMLKSLTGDGEASMEVAIHYSGSMRLTISTSLTISLGSRFKPYTVSLVLAVVLRSLEGNLLLHIKPPPSNRVWFGFTTLPKMEIGIEPVVSERKVQWSMVTRLIEGRIRELLTESLVVPNMDDIPFFDTRAFEHRGGIWAEAGKREDDSTSTSAAAAAAAADKAAAEKSKAAEREDRSLDISESSTNEISAGISSSREESSDPARLRRRPKERPSEAALDDTVLVASMPAATSQSSGASSPAAVGLSSLLSRNDAAVNSTTSLPAGADTQHRARSRNGLPGDAPDSDRTASTKRRSWFVGPRFGVGGAGTVGDNGAVRGVTGSGAGSSSLAWGSASLSMPPSNTSNAAGTVSPAVGGTRPSPSSSAEMSHERGKESVSSMSSLESAGGDSVAELESASSSDFATSMNNVVPTGDVQTPTEESMPKPAQPRPPTLAFQRPSEDALSSLQAVEQPEQTPRVERSPTHASHELDFGNTPSDVVERPQTSQVDVVVPQADPVPASLLAPTGDVPPQSSASSRRSTSSSGTESAPSSAASMMDRQSITSGSTGDVPTSNRAFEPLPPPRRSAPVSPSSTSISSSGLTAAHQNRYRVGRGAGAEGGEVDAAGSLTTPSASQLWNKAKASMADKESRQAAAREARDALKRGWAGWNAKRAEGKAARAGASGGGARSGSSSRSASTSGSGIGGSSDTLAQDWTRSQQENSSRSGSWLASSPPDPGSMGAGIDVGHAAEQSRERATSMTSDRSFMRSTTSDDDGSSSGRPPYKDYRASKSRGQPSSTDESFSPTFAQGFGGEGIGAPTWDGPVPSLAAPAPAARRRVDSNSNANLGSGPNSGPADRPFEGQDRREVSSSASAQSVQPPPQRRTVSSSSSMGPHGGKSFVPAAPRATTGLASGADSGLSPPMGSTALPTLPTPGRDARPVAPLDDLRSVTSPTSTPGTAATIPTLLGSSSNENPMGSSSPRLDASRRSSTVSTPGPAPASSSTSGPAPPFPSPSPGKPTSSRQQHPGIKTQPLRAPMMAVPGIPSMHKSAPQSFTGSPDLAATTLSGGATGPSAAVGPSAGMAGPDSVALQGAPAGAGMNESPRPAFGSVFKMFGRKEGDGPASAAESDNQPKAGGPGVKRRVPPAPGAGSGSGAGAAAGGSQRAADEANSSSHSNALAQDTTFMESLPGPALGLQSEDSGPGPAQSLNGPGASRDAVTDSPGAIGASEIAKMQGPGSGSGSTQPLDAAQRLSPTFPNRGGNANIAALGANVNANANANAGSASGGSVPSPGLPSSGSAAAALAAVLQRGNAASPRPSPSSSPKTSRFLPPPPARESAGGAGSVPGSAYASTPATDPTPASASTPAEALATKQAMDAVAPLQDVPASALQQEASTDPFLAVSEAQPRGGALQSEAAPASQDHISTVQVPSSVDASVDAPSHNIVAPRGQNEIATDPLGAIPPAPSSLRPQVDVAVGQHGLSEDTKHRAPVPAPTFSGDEMRAPIPDGVPGAPSIDAATDVDALPGADTSCTSAAAADTNPDTKLGPGAETDRSVTQDVEGLQ